ncbi:hypothetical protein ACVWXM_006253 [Bradyrhizobium sp. GM7.3]
MTTIGIDLGWRQCRVVVLNELSELIPIPAAIHSQDASPKAGDTAPLVATREAEHAPVVGIDALFGLYHSKEWIVQHALASAAGTPPDVRPLVALLNKLQTDLAFSGYPVGPHLHTDIRVTTDKSIPSDTLKDAIGKSLLRGARFVPRFEAARAYSRMLLDDSTELSRLKDNKEPSDSIVLDLGFHTQCVTVHEASAAREIETDLQLALRPIGDFPEFLRTRIVQEAFATWAAFVSEAFGAHQLGGAFRGLPEREVYRHFERWWRQVLPGTATPGSRLNSRNAPFMLPIEANPMARPFVGCMPEAVLSSIRDQLWAPLHQKFGVWVARNRNSIQAWIDDKPLIIIGQYSDVPQIGDELAKRLQEVLRVVATAPALTTRLIRLPSTGLAAGAAMAAEEALR